MINRSGFRSLLEASGGDYGTFSRRLTHLMGLTDRHGRYYTDGAGNRVLKDPGDGQARLRPDEISLRGLAEALLGEDWDRQMPRVAQWLGVRSLWESDRTLLESPAAGAVPPSAFANINAFTAATAGLLEAGILEAYESPSFIADQIAPAIPSKQFEGRKNIGASRIGDLAEERLPGMPTKRVQFGERWITQPRTVENAMACVLLQEDIYLDLTGGQVAERGNSVGEWLAYRKELRCIDSFIGTGGVSGSAGFQVYVYNYKGNSYNPYIAGGYYDNLITSNDLITPENVLAAEVKFRDMRDPETNTRIMITPNTVLVNKEREFNAALLFGGDEMQYRDLPTSGAGVVQNIRRGPNVLKSRGYTILSSPLVFERINAPDGLNRSPANAARTWFLFERGPKTHVYVQNWPLRTQTAAAGQMEMIDQGIVLYVKADERGIPWWIDPRRAVRSEG